MPHGEATVTFGVISLITGLVGTFAGGWLGDVFLRRSRHSYLWVSGITTLLAAPITCVALTDARRPIYLTAIVVAEVLVFMSTGPVNSAILNAVAPTERATALGLSVFVMHILGDIPSPPLIGALSVASSLDRGLLIVPVAIVIGGVVWIFAAWRGDRATA
jgi:MFS family permease